MCIRDRVSPTHPWAQARHVPRDEMGKQNFILYKRSSYTARVIDDYFRQERIVLNSVIAPWIAREAITPRSLIALSIGRRKLKRDWGVSMLKDRRLGLPEESFTT